VGSCIVLVSGCIWSSSRSHHCLLVSLAVCGPVLSQTPKAIKIVVPFPPRGGSDLLGRILADYIRRTEGITAVVENRAGAGSVIGTDAISHAAPDGATLLINTPNIVIAAHLRKLDYDPLTSFSAGIGSLLISANSILNTARFQQAHIRGE
jgi:tripartite-type tricarboxylate transporter receptor subunit TctC